MVLGFICYILGEVWHAMRTGFITQLHFYTIVTKIFGNLFLSKGDILHLNLIDISSEWPISQLKSGQLLSKLSYLVESMEADYSRCAFEKFY